MIHPESSDVAEIRAIVARQFRALSWSAEQEGDWGTFAGDFLQGAMLIPAARPVSATTVDAFVARMKVLAGTTVKQLDESVAGVPIVHVFGNVAVAVAACDIAENGSAAKRNVEMLLLVKTDGAWRIAAQAWDRPVEVALVPRELLGH